MNLTEKQVEELKSALTSAYGSLMGVELDEGKAMAQPRIETAIDQIRKARSVIAAVDAEQERILEATKKRDARQAAGAEKWRAAAQQVKYLEAQYAECNHKTERELIKEEIEEAKKKREEAYKEWTSI